MTGSTGSTGRGLWPALPAVDVREFLTDPPCALANAWEYFNHSSEVVYKTVPATLHGVGASGAGAGLADWSGFGGLSRRNDSETGLRLAVFGADGSDGADGADGGDRDASAGGGRLKPVLLSLHGGGWYRGSM